jgi:hypothetical protein
LFFLVFGFHSTSFFLFLGAQRTPPCARLDSDGPSFISLRVGLSNKIMVECLNQVCLEKAEIAKQLSIEKQTGQFIKVEYYKFQFICNTPSFWSGSKGFWHSKMGRKVFKSSSLFCFSSLLLGFHCVFVQKEVLLHSKKPFCPFWMYQKTFLLFLYGPTCPICFK